MSLTRDETIPESGFWATLARREVLLWVFVVVAMIADTLLTYYGLERGFVETNPVARLGLERFGYASLGLFKLLALGVGLACRPLLPRNYVAIVPLGLAIPWTVASLVNLLVIGVGT